MRKPHLFSSQEPWNHWGVQLKALCGREIPDAVWIAGVDTYSEMSIETVNLCEKCKEVRRTIYWTKPGEHTLRWEYVISEGQEALNQGIA